MRCSKHVADVDCGQGEKLHIISVNVWCPGITMSDCNQKTGPNPWDLKEVIIRENNAQATYRIIIDRVIRTKPFRFYGTCILLSTSFDFVNV